MYWWYVCINIYTVEADNDVCTLYIYIYIYIYIYTHLNIHKNLNAHTHIYIYIYTHTLYIYICASPSRVSTEAFFYSFHLSHVAERKRSSWIIHFNPTTLFHSLFSFLLLTQHFAFIFFFIFIFLFFFFLVSGYLKPTFYCLYISVSLILFMFQCEQQTQNK